MLSCNEFHNLVWPFFWRALLVINPASRLFCGAWRLQRGGSPFAGCGTAGLLHRGATSAHYLRRWQHVDHIIALSGEKFSLGGMKGIHFEFDGNGFE